MLKAEKKATPTIDEQSSDTVGSPERREFIRRLARTSFVAPTAAVIYSSSTTIAAAS